MRADRLISIVMLLQEHGRMTAVELARALEVSVRTIYRDVEALSMAGVPVYTERGSRGGVVLLESYRSGLTGLTAAEIGALFLIGVPAPLVELGVSEALKSAHRKLAAAAVELSRSGKRPPLNEIYVDSSGWFRADDRMPHLSLVQQAVQDKRQLWITYRHPMPGEPEIAIRVEPYGLVSKANVWYLLRVPPRTRVM